jgi:hypothetical protein
MLMKDKSTELEAQPPVIACDPTPISPEQRERWMEVGRQLYGAIQEIRELPDGYAFRLPSQPEMLLLAAEVLNFERLCCPFIHYTLEVEPNRGPFWFQWRGSEEIKAFVRMGFESANLIDEHVAKAAGFSISGRTDIDSVETALETINLVNERFAGSQS